MKKIFTFFALSITGAIPIFAYAQTPATISINPYIPGVQNVSTAGPCGWIVNFYTFALIVSGILAFGAIVYGGFMYATSAGNASRQGEGRSWIWSALIGLLLLAGAYIVLNTINPSLTTCQISLSGTIAGGNTTGGGTNPTQPTQPSQPTSGNCASGQCQKLNDCTVTPGINGGTTGKGAINCGAAQGMINTMNCIQQNDPSLSYTVSEGYPPAVDHTSAGHNNGCSIDIHVNGAPNTCANIANLQSVAVNKCGDSKPLNEYASCSGGKTFGTTTGNNVHINAAPGQGGC